MKSQVKKKDNLKFIASKSAIHSELSRLKFLPKISLTEALSKLNLWQAAFKAIANSNRWQLCLIAVGSLSSIIYPHPPLVGFAAVAGNTLTRKKALISAMSIWFANQLYGFTIRHYPQTLESFTWGLVMGIGMLFVTWLITLRTKFSHDNFQNYLIWLAVSVIGGFAIYQGSILAIAQLMRGHELSTAIFGKILLKDVFWAIALFTFHGCLVAATAIDLIKQIIKR